MNNNLECFSPLRDALASKGNNVVLLTLPNHGTERAEVSNFEEGLELFAEKMKPHLEEDYHVVAFSLGALYFENWLATHKEKAPLSYVLLAPAVAVNFEFLIKPFFQRLPKTFFILSQMPKVFRRHDKLFFWEYVLLLDGIERFRILPSSHSPAAVFIDLKDELVNARKVKAYYRKHESEFVEIRRKNLKRSLGRHHIIFHPDYFRDEEWTVFTTKILRALSSAV